MSDAPLTLISYPFGSRIISAAASPFSGSVGLGYRRSCGRKTSKMLIMSYMGDQVWLMTSRQTLPDLEEEESASVGCSLDCWLRRGEVCECECASYSSSMLGWKMRFMKPMLGLL